MKILEWANKNKWWLVLFLVVSANSILSTLSDAEYSSMELPSSLGEAAVWVETPSIQKVDLISEMIFSPLGGAAAIYIFKLAYDRMVKK